MQNKKEKDKFIEEIVSEVTNDFEKRRNVRKPFERQWQLNMNFFSGNQYCNIDKRGNVESTEQEFYWQNHEVFNHITPLIEARFAKFSRISPKMCVRPNSDDDKDVLGAEKTEKLIAQVFKKQNVDEVVKTVTLWSEICGSGFYKVIWNNSLGDKIGQIDNLDVFEGGAEVLAVSPFEIFPDSLYCQRLEDCQSIIHARAMPVSEIKKKYNADVAGESIGVFNLVENGSNAFSTHSENAVIDNACIVIERYEKPTAEFPNGRVITVAGGKLLYYGELPFSNGKDKTKSFPFIKQDSLINAGRFFGSSIIERLIPVQRAYNAVKNRKHEFLNRLSMGVLTVEDGSIDVDNLTEEGLCPGKILVYRQGSKAPEIMDKISMPVDFSDEEEKLLNEFVTISGISDVGLTEKNASVRGASALEILVEQDNERLLSTAEAIRNSYVEISKHIIRLYGQFINQCKLVKTSDKYSKLKYTYIDKDTLSSDDVYCENENELLYSDAQKKNFIYSLLQSGLLNDENDKISEKSKSKVLSVLGYDDLDGKKGIYNLQEEKAQRENKLLRTHCVNVEEIDDDEVHINEHTRYVLGEYTELDEQAKQRFFEHIKSHKLKKMEYENLKEKQYERAS